MSIPYDEHGYAVDPSGAVHRRYAAHARGLARTRTLESALSYIKGTPVPCPECWPQTKAAPKPRAKAKGGSAKGEVLVIGESGPEVIVPATSGRVYPTAEDVQDEEDPE